MICVAVSVWKRVCNSVLPGLNKTEVSCPGGRSSGEGSFFLPTVIVELSNFDN